MGTKVNMAKSGGVRLLTADGAPAEFNRTTSIDFLGHSFRLNQVSIKLAVEKKIKTRIQKLIYYNLIRAPKLGIQNPARLARVDRDYATYIWQLRRYLYGDVSERSVRRFYRRGVPAKRFRGVMSFFPFVDCAEQLEKLDAWLISQTCLAMRRRAALLLAAGLPLPGPHGVTCARLAAYKHTSATTGGVLDLRLPSFQKMQTLVARAARAYGPNRTARALKYSYE